MDSIYLPKENIHNKVVVFLKILILNSQVGSTEERNDENVILVVNLHDDLVMHYPTLLVTLLLAASYLLLLKVCTCFTLVCVLLIISKASCFLPSSPTNMLDAHFL